MKKHKDLSKCLNTCLKIGEAREVVIEAAKKYISFVPWCNNREEAMLKRAVDALLKFEKGKK